MPRMRQPSRSMLRVAAAASLLAAAVAAAAGAACTGSAVSPADAGSDASTPCPQTLAAALGAACAPESLQCFPAYGCGVAQSIARCTCAGGVFACNDVGDAALDATPPCPPRADAEVCPASERAASLAACTESGRKCPYVAPCDVTEALDTCACSFGALPAGGMGLRFECSTACTYLVDGGIMSEAGDDALVPEGAPVDQGAPETAGDASPTEASD